MLVIAWPLLIALIGEPGALATGDRLLSEDPPVADAPGSPAPPVVGRPVDFSGAVGGPFVVEQTAEPTALTAEEPLTLTVRITGPGNLRDLPRPELGKLEAHKAFAVDDLDERFVPGDPPRREFRYRLRPRSADVKEVPRLKFVYFNPRLPAARGYQTTYAAAVPLTVKPQTPAKPPEIPGWILQEWDNRDEEYQQSSIDVQQWRDWLFWRLGLNPYSETKSTLRAAVAIVIITVSPVLCVVWFTVWRRRHPDAARLASLRRSRAAAAAIRSLRSTTEDTGRHIGNVVRNYLQARVGLSATAVTPPEVAAFLRESCVA